MSPIYRVPTGLSFIDQATLGGLPSADLNVFATSDDRIGSMVLGHYLNEGLKQGEKVALITFDKAAVFFENFELASLDFKPAFQEERLFFLNYQPTIRQKMSFVPNFDVLFDEIFRLCNQSFPSRIAFHFVDALLNMSNLQLCQLTSEKFGSACKAKLKPETSVLSHFVKFSDRNHHDLAVSLEKIAAGYFELLASSSDKPYDLQLKIRKMPWYNFDNRKIEIPGSVIEALMNPIKKESFLAVS